MHTDLRKDKEKLVKTMFAEKTNWKKAYPFNKNTICFCYKNYNHLPLKVSIKPSRTFSLFQQLSLYLPLA